MQKHTLCRAFSGLLQTCQPPKGKKCVVQRNGYKVARRKLWGKIKIVGSFNAERLVPYGSKKMMREKMDLFVFSLVHTLS